MLATAKYIAKFIGTSYMKLKNQIKIMKTLMNKKVFFFLIVGSNLNEVKILFTWVLLELIVYQHYQLK